MCLGSKGGQGIDWGLQEGRKLPQASWPQHNESLEIFKFLCWDERPFARELTRLCSVELCLQGQMIDAEIRGLLCAFVCERDKEKDVYDIY